jgi:hypothetical protein
MVLEPHLDVLVKLGQVLGEPGPDRVGDRPNGEHRLLVDRGAAAGKDAQEELHQVVRVLHHPQLGDLVAAQLLDDHLGERQGQRFEGAMRRFEVRQR